MTAEDELALTQVPEAKPEDPEDVSWALSTAEAMWARGDHLEGIKWVRKAAEAASDVEDDNRALELAKAASELTSVLSRRAPAGAEAPRPSAAPIAAPAPAPPPAFAEAPARPQPPPVPKSSPSAAPPFRPSAPPAAFGSRPSQPPRPPQAPQVPRAAPRPPGGSEAPPGLLPGRGILVNRSAGPGTPSSPPSAPGSTPTLPGTPPKARRRSRENLENEARAAGVNETAPLKSLDTEAAARALAGPSRAEPDPTIVGRFADLTAERSKSIAAWDASPTQNLSGDGVIHARADLDSGDRMTAFEVPAAPAAAPAASARPPQLAVHDPGIQTSQAVRVVVWRDAGGVHVAPAGTVVSAITIDAVLVVLEPSADLTAWLSQRER